MNLNREKHLQCINLKYHTVIAKIGEEYKANNKFRKQTGGEKAELIIKYFF